MRLDLASKITVTELQDPALLTVIPVVIRQYMPPFEVARKGALGFSVSSESPEINSERVERVCQWGEYARLDVPHPALQPRPPPVLPRTLCAQLCVVEF